MAVGLTAMFAPSRAHAAALVVCTEASPDGFDVVEFNSLVTTNASADVIFNGLVAFDASSGKVVPALAERWDVSADGLRYTFHLRGGVQFQKTAWFTPTRAFDADDVVFTFSRMLDPQAPWHKVAGPSGFPHAQSMQLTKLIRSIDAIDAQTVRFTLSEPNATFLPVLTMGFASIYSAEYADQLLKANRTADMNTKPVGTGPFMLRNYTKDAVIRYDVNSAYWGAKPRFDKLIYAITPDTAVRLQKVKTGECAIALSPKPQDVLAARSDKKFKLSERPAFMTAFVAINTQHAPLDNPKVRQAINLAFDRDTYVKAVFDGTATPAVGPYPETAASVVASAAASTAAASYARASAEAASRDARGARPYPHDIAAAKKLLAEAGYANGFTTTIWTRPTGSVLNPDPKLSAELLQADLAKIGITAQIKVVEWGELIRSAKQGQHDLLFMGWAGDNGDPDNFLTPQFSCASVQSGINFARYCDPKLDALIGDARRTNDPAKRAADYDKARQMIHDAALWVPLAYPTAAAVMRPNVEGFAASPFGRVDFTQVTVN
ncbi:ABC transporter substrate-binding protein [Pararobbsia silviterrae]|uniref:ABC transporter substrate-binding protein n=1 Tax=Pararobbsia silviterrae TaxID=1792498 RepID=A0A494Y9T9_9BURK|nr:ABC transporter substrate-binding protein [Pararobbsia silviterrae]RKP59379.1 ABC transporter substrate-binding protein [Pararobbsia silviterrae]